MREVEPMTISFIVCSNGYGHLKRVLLVISELFKQNPKVSITLFCSEKHLLMAKREINFTHQERIQYDKNASDNEISWLLPASISIQKYHDWCMELSSNSILQDSSLIVSDNHVAPLNSFSNIILMGSFLWHDVVTFRNQDVDEIVLREEELLAQKRPHMICVEGMLMDAVKQQTKAVPVPWFGNKYEGRFDFSRTHSILITGGGTELTNALLAEICLHITEKNKDLQIFLDAKLFELVGNRQGDSIQLFDFSDESFSKLTAIVCRPGIGILTDCVRYSVPVVTVNDAYNKEIIHNASRVTDLGIGTSINTEGNSSQKIADFIVDFVGNTNRVTACINQLEKERTTGAEMAAGFILHKLAI